jgi:hypothetical protein
MTVEKNHSVCAGGLFSFSFTHKAYDITGSYIICFRYTTLPSARVTCKGPSPMLTLRLGNSKRFQKNTV